MIRAHALYEGTYLLGTSIARPLIGKRQIQIAKKFIKDGNYLWNSGIFMFNAKDIIEEYRKLQSKTHESFNEIIINQKQLLVLIIAVCSDKPIIYHRWWFSMTMTLYLA